MMYLILTKRRDSIGRSIEGYHSYFTDDKMEVAKALSDDEQDIVVYRLDDMTRIVGIDVDYFEREAKGA